MFELRQAFLGSGSLSQRAREFRDERLGRILGGDLPVPLDEGKLVCVHLIPHVALAGSSDVDLFHAETLGDYLTPERFA